MDVRSLQQLELLKKRQCRLLTEASDLTRQLAQALERRDRVSADLLLGMRQEPLLALGELDQQVEQTLMQLPEEDAVRGNELLHGAQPTDAAEKALCSEVARFQRQKAALVALDRQLSLRAVGRKSFYKTFREET